MASAEKREAIRASIKEAKATTTAGGAKFVAAPKPKASPLEDEATQAEILNPAPLAVTIGGEPVEIHELAAKHARALCGLMQTAIADLFAEQPTSAASTFSMRLAALVAERYGDRVLPFIARSTAPAGEIAESDVPRLAAEIDARMDYAELAVVLAMVIRANRVIEALTPKQVVAKNG